MVCIYAFSILLSVCSSIQIEEEDWRPIVFSDISDCKYMLVGIYCTVWDESGENMGELLFTVFVGVFFRDDYC